MKGNPAYPNSIMRIQGMGKHYYFTWIGAGEIDFDKPPSSKDSEEKTNDLDE